HGHRSLTPPRDNSPPRRSPHGSDGEDIDALSRERDHEGTHSGGFERPPPLGTYDGKTDPDEHIDNINAILDFRMVS
ncbi:hypothetical protein A2U01_0097843, partial [Trifolium medium]|nr:hypothetical protein [Trifolium medium]